MTKKHGHRKTHKKLLNESRFGKELRSKELSSNHVINKKDETYYLTGDERYRVVMEFTGKGLEKITVGYEIEINSKWVTVKLYDNTHNLDQLHLHTKKSLNDLSDIISSNWVIKKGGPSKWLTWARRDILKNGWYYKRAFLKRSKLVDN